MSRASDVRDAIVTAIAAQLPGETVEAFSVPHYTKEQLVSGPRIAVRCSGRNLQISQGPDQRAVLIDVCVIGAAPEQSTASFRVDELGKVDEFDELMESVIALWTPAGTLGRSGMAYHSFEQIEQVIQVDQEKLYTDGIYISVIRLTYHDSEDD